VGVGGHFLISRSKESNSEVLSMLFQCRDILAVLIPIPACSPYVDDEILGQLGLGISVHPVADGAWVSRGTTAAGPRPFPRPFWMGLTDPAAVVAAGAKSHDLEICSEGENCEPPSGEQRRACVREPDIGSALMQL
jgi:hypothetical protein